MCMDWVKGSKMITGNAVCETWMFIRTRGAMKTSARTSLLINIIFKGNKSSCLASLGGRCQNPFCSLLLHVNLNFTHEPLSEMTLQIQAPTVETLEFGLSTCWSGVHACKKQAISAGSNKQDSGTGIEGSVQLHNDSKQALWGPENPASPAGSISFTQVTNAWKWFTDCLMSWGVTWSLRFQDKKRLFLKNVWSFWYFAQFLNVHL